MIVVNPLYLGICPKKLRNISSNFFDFGQPPSLLKRPKSSLNVPKKTWTWVNRPLPLAVRCLKSLDLVENATLPFKMSRYKWGITFDSPETPLPFGECLNRNRFFPDGFPQCLAQ